MKQLRVSCSSRLRASLRRRTFCGRSVGVYDLNVLRKVRRAETQEWNSRSEERSMESVDEGEEMGSSGEGTECMEGVEGMGVEGTECRGEGGAWSCVMRSWFC